MCIIVDANAIQDLSKQTEDGKPVLNWLLKGRGGLVVGGELTRELDRGGMRDTLVSLSQAGRLKSVDETKISSVVIKIKKLCCSNDVHIVAIALVSGCRLIFTKDHDLHKDMKNCDIISPAASIYQHAAHAHLLKDCHCPS